MVGNEKDFFFSSARERCPQDSKQVETFVKKRGQEITLPGLAI